MNKFTSTFKEKYKQQNVYLKRKEEKQIIIFKIQTSKNNGRNNLLNKKENNIMKMLSVAKKQFILIN